MDSKRKTGKLMALLVAVLMAVLLLPAAALAADGVIEIYTSAEGRAAGDYYFDMDAFANVLYDRRYSEKQAAGADADACAGYAAEKSQIDLAQFKATQWYIDPVTFALDASFPAGYNASAVFSLGNAEDEALLLAVLKPADADSLTWTEVPVPVTSHDQFEHRQFYLNLNMVYAHYYEEGLEIYAGLDEWEAEQEAHYYAMSYIEPMQASEYYLRDDDPLFRVKRVSTDAASGEQTVTYFPYASLVDGLVDDESQFVVEYHFFFEFVDWEWTDKDHAKVFIPCFLDDDEMNILEATGSDIVQEILREPTELHDGEVRCTATLQLQENVYTDTHNFPIPATGNPERPVITLQPSDVTVSYPAGASFHIEVGNPEIVASYQWVMNDGNKDFYLEGSTAFTDTLVIPSTTKWTEKQDMRCVITDVNGNITESETATLYFDNPYDDKPVLYVGDYALEPGDTLDLSTTPLGSGIVSYDADGVNMTFDNVKIHGDAYQADVVLSPSLGVFFNDITPEITEYYMHFIGDCELYNNYFDEDINSGGVVLNSHLCSSLTDVVPTLYIDGDGLLSIFGGSDAIYTDANLDVDIDVKSVPLEKNHNTGISATSLFINEGVQLDITCVGTALLARTDMRIFDGASVRIDTTAGHVSNGNTEVQAIYANNLYCGKADIDIAAHAIPELLVPYGRTIGYMNGIRVNGNIDLKGTKVGITMDAQPSDTPYAGNFCAVTGEPLMGLMLSEGAEMRITAKGEDIYFLEGIAPDNSQTLAPGGAVIVEDGSKLSIDLCASGDVLGIDAGRPVRVIDGILDISVASVTGEAAFGILCPELEIELNEAPAAVRVKAQDGIAVFVADGESVEATEYDPAYVPVLTKLAGNANIVLPADGVVSSYGFEIYDSVIPGETVYDPSAPGAAASRVAITTEDEYYPEPAGYADVASDAWYYEAVNYATENGLMNGVGGNLFDPEGVTTRAMIVTMLHRLAGEPIVNSINPFDDVANGEWYTDAIVWAAATGIVEGYGGGKFGPTDNITREQFAAIIYRYEQKQGGGFVDAWDFLLEYDDADQISSWANEAVHWCVMEEIIQGRTSSTLVPQGNASRAEAATIFMRYIESKK